MTPVVAQHTEALYGYPPTGHVKGSTIQFSSGVWETKNQRGNLEIAKGIISTSAQTVYVHLLNDQDSTGTRVWCPVKLLADAKQDLIFDAIADTGNPTMANVTIWF